MADRPFDLFHLEFLVKGFRLFHRVVWKPLLYQANDIKPRLDLFILSTFT